MEYAEWLNLAFFIMSQIIFFNILCYIQCLVLTEKSVIQEHYNVGMHYLLVFLHSFENYFILN